MMILCQVKNGVKTTTGEDDVDGAGHGQGTNVDGKLESDPVSKS